MDSLVQSCTLVLGGASWGKRQEAPFLSPFSVFLGSNLVYVHWTSYHLKKTGKAGVGGAVGETSQGLGGSSRKSRCDGLMEGEEKCFLLVQY